MTEPRRLADVPRYITSIPNDEMIVCPPGCIESDHWLMEADIRPLVARFEAENAAMRAAIDELSAEYHAAINEPSDAGTRADWIWRAGKAEAEVAALRTKLAEIRTACFEAFTYPRDGAGFALCHHGRRIACDECVAEDEQEAVVRSPVPPGEETPP